MGFWLALNTKHQMSCEWKCMEQVLIVDCKAGTFLWLIIGKIYFYKDIYDSRSNLTLLNWQYAI